MTRFFLVVASLLALMPNLADAGCRARRSATCQGSSCSGATLASGYGYSHTYAVAAPQAPALVAATPQAAGIGPLLAPEPIPVSGDPYGFGPWLNATRARHGLHPLDYDPGLASLAAANSSRGMNHHGFNPGRENVGMGSLGQVEAGWLSSPAHAAALLDRGVRSYGIAHVRGVWTFNCR
jgi:uncharacterized protein YkwD